MTTTLITGSNKGLGRDTARRLLADGHEVWLAARDPAHGEATADELGGHFVQLDVTDEESVTAAAALVATEAGERSPNPVVVNVSSGMGSLAVTTDPERLESKLVGIAYPASKSAVTMITTQYAKAYPQMRINAVDPGYTATDLNGHRGTKTVEQGADIIVRAAQLDAFGPTDAFLDSQGTVPW